MIQKYQVEVIAIGNGTASKETEMFTAEVLVEPSQQDKERCAYMVVSRLGRRYIPPPSWRPRNFPSLRPDPAERAFPSPAGLQDPLAELVKIDPKAIGVGQYQHDMPKKRLDEALGGVVRTASTT